MPRALISGITGQDGSYLTELLLDKGYEVHGMVRRTSSLERSRLVHLYRDPKVYGQRLFLHYADLDDPTTMRRVINSVEPDELYHLAGQSHVGLSFEIPESTCDLTAMGTLRLLEMVQDMRRKPRFFHAASSEIFGQPAQLPQDENTPYAPVNPYGCAKAFAAHMVTIYRKTFGHFAVNGIIFNHESPRRGENFVTRKICRAAAAIKLGQQKELLLRFSRLVDGLLHRAIKLGQQKELLLGDTSAKRDWGSAQDYVRGMWLALQHATAEDYIFATGKLHSVQDVVETAFATVNLDWRQHVRKDNRLLRPAEPQRLCGNPAKARRLLNWEPAITFKQLIEEMTKSELALLGS